MRARDLVSEFPTIPLDAPAADAARIVADRHLLALIVVDDGGSPVGVLPATAVLRLAVPRYCLDDPALARVVDEAHADAFLRSLAGRTVRDCMPDDPRELPVTDPDATVLEVAALMARTSSPLVAVMDDGRLLGAVLLTRLLGRVLSS
ncbi:CBS domain-containing protein [Streptosporangium sp. NPDC048047]|uniref:CBS domain-containing protein n=1 Tax=Streptosporangium sp. NPDC048047 TaxID=3155748 RepID=UPI0034279534